MLNTSELQKFKFTVMKNAQKYYLQILCEIQTLKIKANTNLRLTSQKRAFIKILYFYFGRSTKRLH